nr:hypothetical protein [Tanacetum cinerariifolium]
MSSASYVVTYTSVYTDFEPGRPVAPLSTDYIPGPKEPQIPPVPQEEDEREPMFIQPHDPDNVPRPIYPEYIPLEDEHMFLAEEQPLPPIVSPTAESPRYVAGSDPEEYEDDESEDGPVDYPMDGETMETMMTAFISHPPEVEVERLLAMPTPPPSPLTSLSPPSAGDRLAKCTAPPVLSPPPIPSLLLPSSGCPTQIQTLRLASAQALIDAVTATLPSPPLPPLPPPLYIPPHVDRRDDIPKTDLPPRKRLCLFALGFRYEIGESFIARPTRGRGIDYGFVSTLDAEARRQGIGKVGYGIRDTWVDSAEVVSEIAPMTLGEINNKVIELAELHEHDTQVLYALLEDAQDSRTRIS